MYTYIYLQESRYKERVTIDRRVHSRMIGAKGRQVKRIMDEYEVEIRFPRENDPDPNVVIVSGEEEKVLDCKDYLLSLEEDFVSKTIVLFMTISTMIS